MIDFDLILHLYKIALANVHYETIDFFVEKCYRHYSKTYHTPLMQVKKEVTPTEAILTYFEDTISNLPPEERWKAIFNNLQHKKPVIPDISNTEHNIIDEEGEEEFLLHNLISKLQKEADAGAQKEADGGQPKEVETRKEQVATESAQEIKEKMLDELFKESEAEGLPSLPLGETKFDLDE